MFSPFLNLSQSSLKVSKGLGRCPGGKARFSHQGSLMHRLPGMKLRVVTGKQSLWSPNTPIFNPIIHFLCSFRRHLKHKRRECFEPEVAFSGLCRRDPMHCLKGPVERRGRRIAVLYGNVEGFPLPHSRGTAVYVQRSARLP